ncbi:MAG: cation diffusion facilitator family transporter [bacterium]|nr:cation diffusion facilitator family transporter [bacterium]
MLADGVNNLADVGVSIALYVGLRLAQRPPDEVHAYGHGKVEIEVSRVVSIAVLATGGGIIVGALARMGDQHPVPDRLVMVVAFFAILLKLFMYCYQNRLARQLSSGALAADAMNHKMDAAATACVLVGTAAIWIGGPDWVAADDVAAVLVGALMIRASSQSIWEATSALLDEMPPPEIVDRIRLLAEHFPKVKGVEKIVGRKMGLFYLIDLHLEVDGDMPVVEAHKLGHVVKDWLMVELPEIGDIIVHVEPVGE